MKEQSMMTEAVDVEPAQVYQVGRVENTFHFPFGIFRSLSE
jgi:hypothetical protein